MGDSDAAARRGLPGNGQIGIAYNWRLAGKAEDAGDAEDAGPRSFCIQTGTQRTRRVIRKRCYGDDLAATTARRGGTMADRGGECLRNRGLRARFGTMPDNWRLLPFFFSLPSNRRASDDEHSH